MTGDNNWEDLRRLARTLENTLDTKLVAFSRLGSRHARESKFSNENSKEESMFETMSLDIEQILDRLSQVNDKMWNLLHPDNSKEKGNGIASVTNNVGISSANDHTMQRHREILLDYQREYRRTRDNIIALRERERLLQTPIDSMKSNIMDSGSINDDMNDGVTTRLLIEESDHLHSSERMVDQQIGLAETIRNALTSQHTSLQLARSKVLVSISQRLPVVGSLIQKINLRRRRDSVILGCVIGLCVCFIIYFAFR